MPSSEAEGDYKGCPLISYLKTKLSSFSVFEKTVCKAAGNAKCSQFVILKFYYYKIVKIERFINKVVTIGDMDMWKKNFAAILSALALSLNIPDFAYAAKRQQKAQPQQVKKSVDSPLEDIIEGRVKKMRREGRISADEKTAFSVYYFNTDKKLVSINEETPMLAASMVKPFVALAYFHQVAYGKGRDKLSYNVEAKYLMAAMIQRSSNKATNKLIKKIGGPKKVQEILKKNYSGIFKQTSIAQYIPSGGKEYLNRASARDYSRFLYALWNGNIPYSDELADFMGMKKKNRITTNVKVPGESYVYNKTGSTAKTCGDMGIIYLIDRKGAEHVYTVIGIIEKGERTENYRRWIKTRGDVLREISGEVHRYIAKK